MLFRPFLPLIALVALVAVPLRADDAWCGVCGDFFEGDPTGHAKTHERAEWCPNCSGVYEKKHVHLSERLAEENRPDERESASTSGADGTSPDSDGDAASDNPLAEAAARLEPLKRYWWAVPVVLAVWLLLLPLLKALWSRSKASRAWDFPMVDGMPQGVELVPGRLVCSENGKDDGGGTAIGYPAMIRPDRKWKPAFVKRMIGKSMSPEMRFPALQFEANVLKALQETGVVPKLLIPPTETTLRGRSDPNGPVWAYYAMSVAAGAPWPASGGFGDDTRLALYALCESIVRLHDLGIGHHDLKPQNLFWDADHRRVTLIDLGSAIDHLGRAGAPLVNPLGATYAATIPWVAPRSDGTCLANLSLASDAWVYGLLFCEALVGGVVGDDQNTRHWHAADLRRKTSDRLDREWFFQRLKEVESADLAHAVVDGLFAQQASGRMPLSDFLGVLQKEGWG